MRHSKRLTCLTASPLDPAIQVLPGTNVGDVWDRFEVFEALHHTMQICNPMTTAQLDGLIEALDLSSSDSVYDAACGYGELLFRAVEAGASGGVGIDLSPWMIRSAHATASRRDPSGRVQWILGEARDYQPVRQPTVAVCIGAEWVWHDFNGTCRALAGLVGTGAIVVIGAARLHHRADPAIVRRDRGHVDTVDDMAQMLRAHGLAPFHRIDPDDAGWDAYLARTAVAAQRWADANPGLRAQRWLDEQDDWQAARERDRDVIGWSLWMARKFEPGA